MPSEDRKKPFLKKIYLYIIGLGLMLFGMLAIFFRTVDHPIYGHLDFTEYHKYIGAGFLLLCVAFMSYIRKRF